MSSSPPLDSAFEQMRELFKLKDFKEWESIYTKPELSVYRQAVQGKSYYKYLCKGHFSDVTPATMLEVFLDDKGRSSWDPYSLGIKTVETKDGAELLHWTYKFPWPMSNRDYLFWRKVKQDEEEGVYMMVCDQAVHPSHPEGKSVVRVLDYTSSFIIKTRDEGGCTYVCIATQNLQGSIPSMIMNWAVSKGLPQYMDTLHTACLKKQDKK